MIGMILLFIFSINRRAIFLIIAILISSCRLYNIPQSRFRSQNIQSSEILKGGFIKNGKQIFIDKRKKCTRRIILNGHQINCRYTDPK
jgi:competence protein ComEC